MTERSHLPAHHAFDQHPRPSVARKADRTGSNGDESRIRGADGKPNYIGNYHKGLPHNELGEVDPNAYAQYLRILENKSAFYGIRMGCQDPDVAKRRKLTNPQGGLATDVEGPDPNRLEMRAAPTVDSAETAAEAVELYWMALLRDVPFTEFDSHPEVAAAAKDLTGLIAFAGPKDSSGAVTPQTIFRGNEDGNLVGPFVSQFLLRPIKYGAQTIDQRMRTVRKNSDHLTQFEEWRNIQNGCKPDRMDDLDPTPRYIRNMRDFGEWVHVDALYQAYLNACLVLLDCGAPFDGGNPYEPPHPDSINQIGFGTFGGPHILSLVTEVATRALKAVWYQKWFVHRRLRPEAYGGLIQVKQEGVGGKKRDYPIHPQVLTSNALASSRAKFGSWLLPMAFPEGSPTHPSYGAGHATVAGACVTILKAWFKEDQRLTSLVDPMTMKPFPIVVPTPDGTETTVYSGADANSLTVEGELNKVAADIAIARNMAGVHWRSDYFYSLLLGEAVALSVLKRQRRDYHENGWSFTFRRFEDGKKITVSERGVFMDDGSEIDV